MLTVSNIVCVKNWEIEGSLEIDTGNLVSKGAAK